MTSEEFEERARFLEKGARGKMTPAEIAKLIRKIARDSNPHPIPAHVVDRVLGELNLSTR